MAQTTTMTVRISTEVAERLGRLSQATDRTKSYLAGKAIEDFIATQEWQIKAISDAVREADAPGAHFTDHGDVVARMRKKAAPASKSQRS